MLEEKPDDEFWTCERLAGDIDIDEYLDYLFGREDEEDEED